MGGVDGNHQIGGVGRTRWAAAGVDEGPRNEGRMRCEASGGEREGEAINGDGTAKRKRRVVKQGRWALPSRLELRAAMMLRGGAVVYQLTDGGKGGSGNLGPTDRREVARSLVGVVMRVLPSLVGGTRYGGSWGILIRILPSSQAGTLLQPYWAAPGPSAYGPPSVTAPR